MSAADVAAAAARAPDWEHLVSDMSGCTACDLSLSRRRVVPGVRPGRARVLLVGEAPGREEDEGGLPFVGRSGRLLDELLADAGLDRSEMGVVNTVKCRPPANRTPLRREASTCRPWLDRQVELTDPAVVVTLGGSALAWAMGSGRRLGDVRGQVQQVMLPRQNAAPGPHDGQRGRVQAVLPTYHPSAALRFGPKGAPRAALAADLRLLATLLDEAGR